jgi:cyclic beta-1,2-glucan synthetase
MQATSPSISPNPATQDTGDRLREFAHHLAKTHAADAFRASAPRRLKRSSLQKAGLLENLVVWEQVLHTANAIFKTVPANDLPISRAGEWMLDNFFIVRQTFHQIEEDLPPKFLNQLPRLAGTAQPGEPRPVSRTGTGTTSPRVPNGDRDYLAETGTTSPRAETGTTSQEPGLPRPVSRTGTTTQEPGLPRPVEKPGLPRPVQGPGLPRPVQEPGLPRIYALAWEWLAYSQGQIDLAQTAIFMQAYQQVTPLTIGELWALPIMLRIGILERLVYAATQLTGMAAPGGLSEIPGEFAAPVQENETSVANCFLGLRLLATTDWDAFFEQTSRVEQVLRTDPAKVYAQMDFDTRNNYRNVVEELAQNSASSEEQVALAAVELARSAGEKAPGRPAHVGFYLLDAGRPLLEARVRYQMGLSLRIRRAWLSVPTLAYLGSIGLLTLLFLLGLLAYASLSGGSLFQRIFAGVFGIGLALETAILVVNWNVTHRIKPQRLPRMDFSGGIPSGNRTMVVIPSLLESAEELKHLLQALELYYLSNPDPQLSFALLTDFGDAPSQDMPGDEQLLALARTAIEDLNKKYEGAAPFYFFHRRRQWNPSEGVWMGWERKRGKLADFNQYLLNLGEKSEALPETVYATQFGDVSALPDVKYVITLDADTSLPQGSASQLIATLAHPLNHAEFAPDGCSVIAGYTVLQPRVDIKPTSANRSVFSQIFTGNAGFDLYSFAVSDVYQDLFGEGSYVGKGIYDIAAFERSLAGQVRQNTLLSHDLFEGIYGRAALVTDIILYEEYPSRYLVYAHRLRRWIRGDWQLLPWLFPTVHTQNGLAPNRLSMIDRWKIIDNLRRSLMSANVMVMLTAGWLFLPGSPLVWTLLALLPSALPVAVQLLQQGRSDRKRAWLKRHFHPSWLPLKRWALSVLFLPFESLLALSAIGITIARMFIVRKHMLQWTTAASVARSFKLNTLYETWNEMAFSALLTVLLGASITIFHPGALWVASALLIAWWFAPLVVSYISQPVRRTASSLTEAQQRQVRRLARRTWAFFEQFTGPNDHWLPPDHFQESPRGDVAHYTTPTNIGLYLVSSLSAYDLGYIDLLELAVRLRSTFESMDKLEHYRGHLLNWYDSKVLAALPPHFVSTVDSGNLAACLLTLRQGCLALPDAKLMDSKRWQGLLVLLDILSEILQNLEKNNLPASIGSFKVELTGIYARVSAVQDQPAAWKATLDWLAGEGWARLSQHLMELLKSHAHLQSEGLSELQLYVDLMYQHLQGMRRSLDLFAPWFKYLDAPAGVKEQSAAWQDFREALPVELPALRQAAELYECIRSALSKFQFQPEDQAGLEWCQKLAADLLSAHMATAPLLTGFQDLAGQASTAVTNMDFRFLFDEHRQLFHIGYTPAAERLDPSYYDLLASESRIASLVAIAKGDVPQSHWQHLGRPVTEVNGKKVLLSWSGTMFEYLMPTLFARNYTGTFLLNSCYAALEAQMSYGHDKQVPWGISESGFYAFDLDQHYQYRAFGVPDLGYKRDLPDDLVITPYASVMGLSLSPRAVWENMAHLEQLDMLGRFGFYEALDYTKTRLPANQAHATVRSYMAHHQGMIMLATCNYLLGDIMVKRFHADEHIQSVELLLQEKIPQNPPLEFPHTDEPANLAEAGGRWVNSEPWRVPVDTPLPQVHVLSQGDTTVLITNAGGGFSQWRKAALTRWHADPTLDQWGTWIYVQDRESGAIWSVTSQPIVRTEYAGAAIPARDQEVLFYPHKVEFQRSDNDITLRTGITVSVDGVEIRRVNILNNSDHLRRLKLTSYGEVILAEQSVDRRHPAFNKLFIESEYLPAENALLFQRRPRASDEKPVFMIHAMLIEAGRKVTGEYTTDRAEFLGRSNTIQMPQALQTNHRHPPGTFGPVPEAGQPRGTLDPILSLGQEIDLKPHAKTRVSFLTFAAASRAEALEKLSHYRTGQSIYHAFNNVQVRCEREMFEQGLEAGAVENIQHLLSALLYPTGLLRAAPHILAQNEKGQSGLWAFGISGDYPILLVCIHTGESSLLIEALQAFNYWRSHHITVNLVILNEQDTGYSLDLHNTILRQVKRMGAQASINQREGIFVLRTDQLQPADKILLQTVAGVILDEKSGTLAEHALRLTIPLTRLPGFTASLSPARDPEPTEPLQPPEALRMDNGLGGFDQAGREYIIHLKPGQHTPHPWVNIIANPQFGFLVSEAGSSCTWAGNSGENRLTPWRNDPVSDMPGEALYLRDEETGLVWSPAPLPAGADTTHIIRHGAGYSIFESQSHGLNQSMRLFAAPDAPVKIVHLRLKNLWKRPRRITVTYYAAWVLGTTRDTYQAHIMPEFDADKHALLASNRYNSEFGGQVAFLAANKKPHGVTADRAEFLGRLGSLRSPAALGRIGLESRVNAGLDPCAVIQLHVDLPPGASDEVFFLIGEGSSRAESLALIGRLQAPGQVQATWQAVREQWDEILGNITVETPDPGMDLMLNRWLIYQTLSCRLWGRTALYQSSGAFGFRDQLQDGMALLQTRPDLARAQILEAARHQFEAGDVLHWWNPPSGRGVRTRFSDDLLWLPYVTAEYVLSTADDSILNESLPFLKSEPLKPEEVDRYGQYEATAETYSLYEHCRRALEKGSTVGVHGLPLMGAGDWNDGMNRVGADGRGESIWLGWFLHATLTRFAALVGRMQGDPAPYLQQAEDLSASLEAHGWDGEWYLRAFFDDGARLGSHENSECRIDSIAQSWAVLSGAADPLRAAQAMGSVERLLVKPADQMILLFTPPFDKTPRDPGYIKGYLPGVRENGGQYTHAAIWTAWAFAQLGQGEKAMQLFKLLNPISHADTPEKAARYRVEPYVIAADIYSQPGHTGMGGWTWYTGSSGWMYRLGLEAILGIRRAGAALGIDPCIPKDWPGFKVDYRFGKTHYQISVENPAGVNRGVLTVRLDGKPLADKLIKLVDDGQQHRLQVVMGTQAGSRLP